MDVVSVAAIQQQRQLWVNEVQSFQARIAGLNEEIGKLQRDSLAIDGAIQGCDVLLHQTQTVELAPVGEPTPTNE